MTDQENLRFIRCWTADEAYGLAMGWVRSIHRTDLLTHNLADDGAIGMLVVNEERVPIYSLATQLGLGARKQAQTARIIILNDPLRSWGILVDRVSQVMEVPSGQVTPIPAVAINPAHNYFMGVIHQEDELLLQLAPERLYPESSLVEGVIDTPTHVRATEINSLGLNDVAEMTIGGNGRHKQIIIFFLPGEEKTMAFGLSIFQISEIIEPLPLIPIPNAPKYVLGLVNWRNRPVPIINLGQRLGLAGKVSGNGRERLMITRSPNEDALAAFLVQPNIQVLHLPLPHQPKQEPPFVDHTFTKGYVQLSDKTLIVPDIKALLETA